jgi:hypothetical protein
MALKMLMLSFWVVMPCGLAGGYQRLFLAEDGDSASSKQEQIDSSSVTV